MKTADRLLYIVLTLDVEAGANEDREHKTQEEQLKRGEIGHLHASQVVADHVSWTQDKVAKGAEHTAVTQPPHLQKEQEGVLDGISAYFCRLSAAGTEVSFILCVAGGTYMFFFRETLHLIRALLPLSELAYECFSLLVNLLYIHFAIQGQQL